MGVLAKARSAVNRDQREWPAGVVEDAVRNGIGYAGDVLTSFCCENYLSLPAPTWRRVGEAVVAHLPTGQRSYLANMRDCEDSARILRSLGGGAGQAVELASLVQSLFLSRGLVPYLFGINGVAAVLDFSAGHAYNAVLVHDSDGELLLRFVEPQALMTPGGAADTGEDRALVVPGTPGYELESAEIWF